MADKFPLVVDGTAIKELPNGDNLELTGSNVVGAGTVALTNLTVSGSQGNDGDVLTSTGSGIAWENIAPNATNVAAAGAVMDSELTSIASVKAMDQGVATTNSPAFANLTLSGTGSVKVPAGTTGQRDGSPSAGMFRYNSTLSEFEGYTDAWGSIGGVTGIGDLSDVSTSGVSSGQVLKYNGSNWVAAADAAGAAGTLEAVASGALSNGSKVIINADGTVSAVGSSLVYQNAGTVGSETTFDSGSLTYNISAVFDSSTNKVVLAYIDQNNSYYPTAVVGTVSGTSISFGTPVVFHSGNIGDRMPAAVFDSNSNKVVIAYSPTNSSMIVGTVSGTSITFGTPVAFKVGGAIIKWNSKSKPMCFDSNSNKVVLVYNATGNYGHAVVGTVSGTSISFGTPVVFQSSSLWPTGCVATFDSNSNKVVVAYGGDGANGTAVVGTVSGTSISFGTKVTFNTGNTENITSTFDSNANKVVIAYRDNSNSYYGTARVGTVSGTSISFGSEVVYNTGNANYQSAAFDSNANKIVIAYMDGINSDYGTAVVGTVSGTSISFGTKYVFNNFNQTRELQICFDSNANKMVIGYCEDPSSSSRNGKAAVFTITQSASSNLTAENYIGISNGAYANSATATVQTVGSVDDAQSGLTAGQSYYLQGDGTLSTSAGSPSVFAGTAVAATKLIIKG